MPDPLLPKAAPDTLACRFAGVSPRTFRKHYGDLERDDRGQVLLLALEQATGRPITITAYLQALRAQEPVKRQHRQHMREVRANESAVR
jgi:hypothetical protein